MISDIKTLFEFGEQLIKYFQTYQSIKEKDKLALCRFCDAVDNAMEIALNNLKEYGGNNLSIRISFEARDLSNLVEKNLIDKYPDFFTAEHVALLRKAAKAIKKLEELPYQPEHERLSEHERLRLIHQVNTVRAAFRVLAQKIELLG